MFHLLIKTIKKIPNNVETIKKKKNSNKITKKKNFQFSEWRVIWCGFIKIYSFIFLFVYLLLILTSSKNKLFFWILKICFSFLKNNFS